MDIELKQIDGKIIQIYSEGFKRRVIEEYLSTGVDWRPWCFVGVFSASFVFFPVLELFVDSYPGVCPLYSFILEPLMGKTPGGRKIKHNDPIIFTLFIGL